MPKSSALICCVALGMMHTSVRSANAADLSYQAPPACPDREELFFRITRALARPFEEVPATRFEVAVRATTSGFGATLRVETFEGGAREKTSPEGGRKE
jgi:hypothetical protein